METTTKKKHNAPGRLTIDPALLAREHTYAKMIKVSRTAVHYMVKDGRVPSITIDGMPFVRVNKKEVAKYLKNQKS